jgi:hypothetical protein
VNAVQAEALAVALNAATGKAWLECQVGDNLWVVIHIRLNGSRVVCCDDMVADYPDDEAFSAGQREASMIEF